MPFIRGGVDIWASTCVYPSTCKTTNIDWLAVDKILCVAVLLNYSKLMLICLYRSSAGNFAILYYRQFRCY